jgi:hypothetical protein
VDARAAESLLAFAGETIPGLRGLDVNVMESEDLERVRAAGRAMTARAAVDFALGSGSASARQ